MPHLAAWGKTLIDGALGAAGTNAAAVGFDKLGQIGVLYHGLEVLGRRRDPRRPGARRDRRVHHREEVRGGRGVRAAGAVLTFFGFMHGESVGFAVTPSVALAYAIVAAFLFALSKMPAEAPAPLMDPNAVPAE